MARVKEDSECSRIYSSIPDRKEFHKQSIPKGSGIGFMMRKLLGNTVSARGKNPISDDIQVYSKCASPGRFRFGIAGHLVHARAVHVLVAESFLQRSCRKTSSRSTQALQRKSITGCSRPCRRFQYSFRCFGFGRHGSARTTGRHELLLPFSEPAIAFACQRTTFEKSCSRGLSSPTKCCFFPATAACRARRTQRCEDLVQQLQP